MTDSADSLAARVARLGPNQRALLDQRLRQQPVSGHQLVGRTLAGLGLTHVYGVPGQPVYDTFAACVEAGVRAIGTRHQLSGAMMAAAQNYFAGQQKAATIVSAGAPAANALGAIVQARDNCWPLLVLAGAARDTTAAAGQFMALDAAELCRPIAKSVTHVAATEKLPAAITRAFDLAMRGRPGPVLVQIPEHVLAGFGRDEGTRLGARVRRRGSMPDAAAMEQATALILGAKRPLLIIGAGARWDSPFAALREVVDSLDLPFITSPIGRGTIPDDHPLCMNAIRWIAQSGADLALVLGARLNWTFRHGRQLPESAAIVHVDVHAPEFDRERKPALGVASDIGSFLRALLLQPGVVRCREIGAHRDPEWIPFLRQSRQATQSRREARANVDSTPLSPLRLARELRDATPRDAITIFDGNLVMEAMEQLIPAHEPASRLTPGSSGCLGVGIPFAMAAKLLHPERPVVAICGDFAFGMSAMELETAVRHEVPIVVVVANNDGNGGSLRQNAHMGAGSEPVTRFQPGVRYDRIMAMFGGHAEHVRRPDGIRPAILRAIGSGRPACVNVAVDPDAPFPVD